MKKLSIFLPLVLFLTVSSCDLFNKSALVQPLNGTWTWERTSGGFIGETIDADSVGYSQTLRINDGEAFLYRNDELITAYNIKFEEPGWYERKTWFFYPIKESSISSYISTLKDGKLVLTDACADCYTLYFRKK